MTKRVLESLSSLNFDLEVLVLVGIVFWKSILDHAVFNSTHLSLWASEFLIIVTVPETSNFRGKSVILNCDFRGFGPQLLALLLWGL